MPTTSGLSFYQTDATTSQAITYGFDVLSAGDITVISVASTGAQVVLTLDTDYTLDIDTKTVTCTASSWTNLPNHPDIYPTSDIRIYRTTSILPSIDFKSGAVLSEGDLDTAYKQGLFAAQEMTEDAALTGAGVQAVTENMLETGAVTADKIGANAVTESRILNSAVTNAKIAAGAVNAAKIQNGTVGSDELAANCVTSAKIGANQVTSAQIADNSIGYTEISNANADAVKAAVETEAASSPITPDVLRYSPFAPRCYGVVSYDESTPTIASGSFNVASVSEPSEDKRTVTFAVPFTNTNYVVVATMQTSTTVGDNEKVSITAKSTSSFTMESFHNDAANLSINFVVFGSTLS
jgi:hypothetical protein